MKLNEKIRKRAVYAIFVAAIIYGVVNLGPRTVTVTEVGSNTAAAVQPALPQVMPEDSVSVDSLKNDWGRDPFVYGRTSAAPRTVRARDEIELRMTAVSESNGMVMAVINGHVVARGDVVDGWTITALSKRSATVESDGQQYVLNLGE